MKQITINNEQELYVIPCGKNGYSCLGFDVCVNRLTALSKELQEPICEIKRGSIEVYNEYMRMISIAENKNKKTGWRSISELIPEFMGKEGRKVEVITSWGEKMRFIIGKSTGFIPCHLMIKKRNSSGGGAVVGHPFKSISFLN